MQETIFYNIIALKNICENSILYKIFVKIAILNMIMLNCYTHVFVAYIIYSLVF